MCELSFGHSGCGPSSNLETAAFYQISAIAGEKLVEHPRSLRCVVSCLCAVPYASAGWVYIPFPRVESGQPLARSLESCARYTPDMCAPCACAP